MTVAAATPGSGVNGNAPPRPSLADARASVLSARAWLYGENIESNPLIDLMVLSAIARKHGFVVGTGGTGKSKLARDWMLVLPGTPEQKFVTQFRKDMDTQSIFGPIAVSGLMNDEFRHVIEGFLATALWAYADEFRDASTMVLRSLLMVMFERQFPNGRHLIDVPLMSLIATTNFWHTDPETAALMDRFAFRYIKREVESEAGLLAIVDGQLLRRANGGNGLIPSTPPPAITLDELDVLYEAACNITVPDDVRKAAVRLKIRAKNEKAIDFSVRRLGEGLGLSAVRAILAGRTSMALEDLIVLQDTIASDPDDVASAYELCAEFAGTAHKAANELRAPVDAIQKVAQELNSDIQAGGGKVKPEHAQRIVAHISEVNTVVENIDAKIAQAKADQSDTSPLDALKAEADAIGDTLRGLALQQLGGGAR